MLRASDETCSNVDLINTSLWINTNPNCNDLLNCNNCQQFFMLQRNPTGTTVSRGGYLQSQEDVRKLMNAYVAKYDITTPGNTKYNGFQEIMRNACISMPGLCDTFLNIYCENFSRGQLASSQPTLQYCGCHLPSDPTAPPAIKSNPQCEAVCTRQGVIQRGEFVNDQPTLNAASCHSNVCVINDTSVQATNTGNGSVSFNQVCSSCKSGPAGSGEICTCIISGSNISQTFGQVGDLNTFKQNCCGPDDSTCSNSLCQVTNGTTTQSVNCLQALKNSPPTPQPPSPEPPVDDDPKNPGTALVWTLIIYIIVVIIVVFLLMSNRKPEDAPRKIPDQPSYPAYPPSGPVYSGTYQPPPYPNAPYQSTYNPYQQQIPPQQDINPNSNPYPWLPPSGASVPPA